MAIRQVTRAGVGLVVGIIILAALVFGGLWLVRERGEQARRQEAITIADKLLKDMSDTDVALDTNNGQASNESTESSNSDSASSTADAPSNATELPQTGPAQRFGSVAVAALTTFAIVGYFTSRKQLQNR